MNKTRFWANLSLAVFLALLGFILGGLVPLPSPYGTLQSRILYALFGFLIGLLTFAQIAAWVIRTVTSAIGQLVAVIASEVAEQIGKVTFHKPEAEIKGKRAIILDTSSIIDGRILDVAKTGFLYGNVVVPNFVLEELQQVADSADDLKRARGRRGLAIINALKKMKRISLQIWEEIVPGKKVDEQLVNLGKSLGAKILTADFNLGSVAKIRGVGILNLNELANALKTLPVPGENLMVKLVHEGKDQTQGVGYLPDGTMVVVKDGAGSIGEETQVEVTKIIQGSSGRMIFAHLSTFLNS